MPLMTPSARTPHLGSSLPDMDPDLAARIEAVLAQFRPTLHVDGGDVRLHAFQDGVAEVMMLGACIDCPISVLTMTIGVKRILLKEVPEIHEVRAIFADGTPVPGMKEFMAMMPKN